MPSNREIITALREERKRLERLISAIDHALEGFGASTPQPSARQYRGRRPTEGLENDIIALIKDEPLQTVWTSAEVAEKLDRPRSTTSNALKALVEAGRLVNVSKATKRMLVKLPEDRERRIHVGEGEVK